MKYKSIRVIVKLPGEEARTETIENTLQAFQNAVGGYIETVTITGDLVVICDEDGRLKGLPYNCSICGVDFVGPILGVGVKRDNFADAPIGAAEFTRLFIDKEGGERE